MPSGSWVWKYCGSVETDRITHPISELNCLKQRPPLWLLERIRFLEHSYRPRKHVIGWIQWIWHGSLWIFWLGSRLSCIKTTAPSDPNNRTRALKINGEGLKWRFVMLLCIFPFTQGLYHLLWASHPNSYSHSYVKDAQ